MYTASSASEPLIRRTASSANAIPLPILAVLYATCALFSSRVITLGTLIAVYLSTSDEMLPIMISNGVNITIILKIIGIKVLIGIIMGFIIDLVYRKKEEKLHIHEECVHEHEYKQRKSNPGVSFVVLLIFFPVQGFVYCNNQ